MALGWIDFSKDDCLKVLNVIHHLDEPEAVDELGLGAIRDAFADYFFPGTSTVQTRAKYFLIVPYVLIEAGNGKFGTDLNEILKKVDDEERKCRDIMLKTSSVGVIGRLVPNSWVLRTPSNIYWNGIRSLGIFRENISVEQYIKQSILQAKQRQLRTYGNREKDAEENERDDSDAGDINTINFWNIGDVYRSDWRDGLTIELLPREAVFLKQQIVTLHGDTLFAYILKNDIDLDRYGTFAALTEDIKYSVDDELRQMIELANSFNNLVSIITTRYNLIVSNGYNEDAIEKWGYISNDLERRSGVDLHGIYRKLEKVRNPNLKVFLLHAQKDIKEGNISALDELIKKREISLKDRRRAKTCHAGAFDTQQWIGIDMLDYRYTPAKRIIRDIINAKEGGDV